MSRSHFTHIPTLSGLRGLAALMVLFSHAEHYGYLNIPFGKGLRKIGVELFYVLSGFLISGLYANTEFSTNHVRNYVAARLARVLPLFYTALLCGVALLLVFGHSGYSFGDIYSFFQNVLLLKGTGVLWSVPVEIQYYALFILIWGAWKHQWGLGFIFVISALQVLLIFLLLNRLGDENYLFFWVHFFLIGFILAQIWRNNSAKVSEFCSKSLVVYILSFIAISASIALLPWLRELMSFQLPPIFIDPFVIISIVISFMFTLFGRGPYAILGHPIMRRLGDWSFGIYLIHAPFIFLADGFKLKERLGATPALFLVLLTTIATAALARAIIEVPIGRQMRKYLSTQTSVPVQSTT